MKKVIGVAGLAIFAAVGAWGRDLRYENLTWENKCQKILHGGREVTNAVFRTSFVVPEGHAGSRWMFEAENSGGNFAVRMNGKKVAEAVSPVLRIPLENVRVGTNEVEFFCSRNFEQMETISEKTNPYRERRLKDWNLDGKFSNYHLGFFGAERIVEMSTPGDVRLAYTETSVRRKTLTLKAKIDATEAFRGEILCVVADADGKDVLSFRKAHAFMKGVQTVAQETAWANPHLWDVGDGYLYTAKVTLLKDGQVVDEAEPFRFGFREVWTEGRDVMLNGHPFHARFEFCPNDVMPLNDKTYGYFRYMGKNFYYNQPNPSLWFRDWGGETPYAKQDRLDLCDEKGIVTCYWAPPVTWGLDLKKDGLVESYRELTEAWMDVFRRHPSVIAWSISMIASAPRDGIHSDLIGRRDRKLGSQNARNVNLAYEIAKSIDPSRLVYGHAEGNVTDLASGNCYPNWTPLQEVEEYPLAWSREGDMPWFAAEYGIYDGSFFKDRSLLLTEYASIYFGEKAYDEEPLVQLENTLRFGVEGKLHGSNLSKDVAPLSNLYYDVMRLYAQGTDKYWRSYGVFGWMHFISRFGQPDRWWQMKERTEADRPPLWANPNVEIYSKYMQDLMAYIGGDEVFSDKTHSFYEGETVRKNAVCVWDGLGTAKIDVDWSVTDAAGRVVAKDRRQVEVGSGRLRQVPIVLTAPPRGRKENYVISMRATDGKRTMTDTFAFEVFPREGKAIPAKGNVYLCDPKGKSQWVRDLVAGVRAYAPGQELGPDDVLIVGRDAVDRNARLPYRMADVAAGARVLVLEQHPSVWELFGFRLIDMVTRIVYETPYSGAVMEGLAAEDLRYWRGAPDLLPEYRHDRQVVQPPKCVNRHGVASTVFEIPEAVGFEPIFQCEFDLRYSPLLRFRSGKGCVYYSSFDWTGRVGVDPAATRLARNVLARTIGWRGEPTGVEVLVNDGRVDPRTDEVLKRGGVVLNVALDAAALKARGVRFETRKLYRAKLEGELAKGVTRNLMRWRDALKVNCVTEKGAECDGVWYRRGNEVFLQVASRMLEGRYEKGDPRAHAVEPSILALDILKGRVLTMLGVAPEKAVCTRLGTVCGAQPLESLRDWYAYGPFRYTDARFVAGFGEVLPGEEQALRGDMNPNLTYKVTEKWRKAHGEAMDEETRAKTFDFRRRVDAEADGLVDLTKNLGLEGRASYCYLTHLWDEREAKEQVFAFTFPGKAAVYLNGEKVFALRDVATDKHAREMPANAIRLRLRLRAGENALTLKLATLPGEVAAWAQRAGASRAADEVERSADDAAAALDENLFYSRKGDIGYAYKYIYW